MSIAFPLESVAAALQGMISTAWPEVTSAILYETDPIRLLLDRQSSPQVAVVWGGVSGESDWGPTVGTLDLDMDVFYFQRAEAPASMEATMRAKAAALLNRALEAGNRWSGVTGMHGWKLRDAEPPEAARTWRASGWAVAHIPLVVRFDYER
ncbi:MAG: hypothetical protein HRF45_10940 [Fimbriimonadia bacterium]|jgi:hypothetical protein